MIEKIITSKDEEIKDEKNKEPETYEFTYDEEEIEDEKLQKLLIFCENISEYEVNDDLKDIIGYYYHFCDSKIEYLEDIQESFKLKNNTKRLTDIAKYLDAFTVSKPQHTLMDDFGIKISLLLDLLYSIRLILKKHYEENFIAASEICEALRK